MIRRILATTLILALACSLASAAVDPGDKAPKFKLFGVDYKYHQLSDYADSKATVVVFTCNSCPVAKAYEDDLIALAKEYQPKGIQFLAINPNPADKMPADSFPKMKERAEQKGFPYPYLYDETQEVAHAYGAKVTPHIFVVGPEGTVVYEGSVDNRHESPNYLANALDNILAGKKVENPSLAPFGCSVKYRQAQGEVSVKAVTASGLRDVLKAHRGKVLLVDFWATWCGPCREQFPKLAKWQKEYDEAGLQVISVSLDELSAKDGKVKEWLQQYEADLETLILDVPNHSDFVQSWSSKWEGAIPALFIFDREGNMTHQVLGTQHGNIEKMFRPLLAKTE